MTVQSRPPRAVAAAHLLRALVATLVLAVSGSVVGTAAHEGHDHGPPPPPLPTTIKPRLAIHSDTYELVAILNGASLSLFLDRYDSNEPVTDARISLLAGETSADAEPRPDGTYRVIVPALAKPGRHELVFTISHKDGDDLLAGEFTTSEPPVASVAAAPRAAGLGSWQQGILTLGIGIVVGFALGGFWRWRRPALLLAIIVIGCALPVPQVHAHEGHGHSPAPASDSLSGDIPRRLPDGSIFLPKPTQRLMTVRSQIAQETAQPRGARLVGRIISDPNRSGLVQSIGGGRVIPADGGLPLLGQRVTKGQILAKIMPALPLADQSTLAEKQRELEGALLLARQKLSRLNRLGGASTPRAQVDDTALEIDNLEQRLAILAQAKIQPEALESPIDGVISTSRVVAGQVVQAQDVLFQISDPKSLWVEALIFDALDPGGITAASATMPDGTVLRLAYKGSGRTLQAQAVVAHFAIEQAPPRALVGLPVTVYARQSEPQKGVLLPRDAIVRGLGGEAVVWQHVDPERFVARPVRVESFDGAQVLVTAGIAASDRIVVHAAELISQVR
jgi:cobalt-zinc-cadmium efflux system membrane fusion protein